MNVGPLVVLDEIVLLVVVVFVCKTQVPPNSSNEENPKRQGLHTSTLSFFIFTADNRLMPKKKGIS